MLHFFYKVFLIWKLNSQIPCAQINQAIAYPGQRLKKVRHPQESKDYEQHGDEGGQLGATADPFAHDTPAQ